MSAHFIRKYLTGSSRIRLKKPKRKGAVTKKEFMSELTKDDEFNNQVTNWIESNNIKGKTLDNHPNQAELHNQFQSMVVQKAGRRIDVKTGTSSPAPRTPDKATETMPQPRSSGTTGTSDLKDLPWIKSVVDHELDRFTGNHNMFTQPKPFSNFSKDPAIAKVQKQIVDSLEADGRKGKFSGISGAGGKAGDPEAMAAMAAVAITVAIAGQLGLITPNEAAQRSQSALQNEVIASAVKSLGTISKGDFQQISHAGSTGSTGSGSSGGSISSTSSRLTKENFISQGLSPENANALMRQYRLSIDEIYDEMVTQRNHPPDATTWANAVSQASRDMNSYLKGRSSKNRQAGNPTVGAGLTDADIDRIIHTDGFGGKSDKGMLFTGTQTPYDPSATTTVPRPTGFQFGTQTGAGHPRDPPPTITIPGFGKPTKGPTGKTDTSPPPGPPGGTETKEDNPPRIPDTKDPKFKPKEIPRIPQPPEGDPDSDTDEDEKEEKKVIPSTKKTKGRKPELRPYFLVGGEDSLKISDEEQKREARDWALFNFVSGPSNASIDNPLTQHALRQYQFRMKNTFPDPEYYKPRPFTDYAPRTIMRNVYTNGSNRQPLYITGPAGNKYYRGRYLDTLQNPENSSALLNMRQQVYREPDLAQIAQMDQMNGLRTRNDRNSAFKATVFATKSLF